MGEENPCMPETDTETQRDVKDLWVLGDGVGLLRSSRAGAGAGAGAEEREEPKQKPNYGLLQSAGH